MRTFLTNLPVLLTKWDVAGAYEEINRTKQCHLMRRHIQVSGFGETEQMRTSTHRARRRSRASKMI